MNMITQTDLKKESRKYIALAYVVKKDSTEKFAYLAAFHAAREPMLSLICAQIAEEDLGTTAALAELLKREDGDDPGQFAFPEEILDIVHELNVRGLPHSLVESVHEQIHFKEVCKRLFIAPLEFLTGEQERLFYELVTEENRHILGLQSFLDDLEIESYH